MGRSTATHQHSLLDRGPASTQQCPQWREDGVDRWGGMVSRAGRVAGRWRLVWWPVRIVREVVAAELSTCRAVASAAWWARSGSTLV